MGDHDYAKPRTDKLRDFIDSYTSNLDSELDFSPDYSLKKPLLHVDSLAVIGIKAQPHQSATVQDIYDFLQEAFPFYKA